jgi:hypothetical protein
MDPKFVLKACFSDLEWYTSPTNIDQFNKVYWLEDTTERYFKTKGNSGQKFPGSNKDSRVSDDHLLRAPDMGGGPHARSSLGRSDFGGVSSDGVTGGGQDSFSKKLRNSGKGKSNVREMGPRKSGASEGSRLSAGRNEEIVGDFQFSESDESDKDPVIDFKRSGSDPFFKISEAESEEIDSDKDAITDAINRRKSSSPKQARVNQKRKSDLLVASLTKGLEQNSGIGVGTKSDHHILLSEH